ncbi:hypothetical protein GRI89_16635 [Altererythrobacter salegens]|uniref:Tetratricopeptide repeat-containing protein n=1 Tax=Croceibacterium salegens TaxID=1737568 RepID=A0A6I4T370_9SPHN|nr:hypothetical protein [Croceibacterium salegens]MXO61172.1 hypothetical protein [Croceibacterium salegens]
MIETSGPVRSGCLAAALAVALLSDPASATTMFPQKFTCPVGGETFTDNVIGSYTTFGQRPDGRSYGTLPIYPLVECPGNGFPIYQEEFTPEELAKLTKLVESSEFQALRKTETSYFRLWWLFRQMDKPPTQLANTLLVASWESDDDPVRKARYQALFVTAAAQVPREDGEEWYYYNLRAANALRELGRFEEAADLLHAIGPSSASMADKDELEAVNKLVDGLTRLIAEANPASEPTNLIPPMQAARRCLDEASALSPVETQACASPDYREAIDDWREYQSKRSEADGYLG